MWKAIRGWWEKYNHEHLFESVSTWATDLNLDRRPDKDVEGIEVQSFLERLQDLRS